MADSSITSPLLSEAPRPASPKLAIPEESTPHVSPLIPEPSDPDAADETTPLLASDAAEGSPTATGRSKAFYVLTILSLVFSAATIIFMCLAYLAVLTAALGYQWNYQAEEAIPAAITLASTSLAMITRVPCLLPTVCRLFCPSSYPLSMCPDFASIDRQLHLQ